MHSLEPSPDGTLVAFTEGLLLLRADGEAAYDERNERCNAAATAWGSPLEGQPSPHDAAEGSEPAIQRYGQYTLHVLHAGSGLPAAPPVHRVQGPLVWSPDGRAVNFLASGGSQLWTLPIEAASEGSGVAAAAGGQLWALPIEAASGDNQGNAAAEGYRRDATGAAVGPGIPAEAEAEAHPGAVVGPGIPAEAEAAGAAAMAGSGSPAEAEAEAGMEAGVEAEAEARREAAGAAEATGSRLVFEDPQWLCMVFRTLVAPDGCSIDGCSSSSVSRSVITAQCLGSDMVAAQVLLLLPGDAPAAANIRGRIAAVMAGGPGHIAGLGGLTGPSGGEGWRWISAMPRTRGSRLEMHPVSLPPPLNWAPAVDGTDPKAVPDPTDPATDPADPADPAARTDLATLSSGRPTTAAAAAASAPLYILIRHWDLLHPLGELLLLRIPIEGAVRLPVVGAVAGAAALSREGDAPEAPSQLGAIAAAAADSDNNYNSNRPCMPSLQPCQLLLSPPSQCTADGDGAHAEGSPVRQQRKRRLVQVQARGGRVLLVHEEMTGQELAAMHLAASAVLGYPKYSAAQGGTCDGGTSAGTPASSASGMAFESRGFSERDYPAADGRVLHVSLYGLVLPPGPPLLPSNDHTACLNLLAHQSVVLPLPFVHLLPVHWRAVIPGSSRGSAPEPVVHAVQLQYSSLGAPPRSFVLELRESLAAGGTSVSSEGPAAGGTSVLAAEPAAIILPALSDGTSASAEPSEPIVLPTLDDSPYVHEALWATSRDGTPIPLSLVYSKRASGGGGGGRPSGATALLQVYGAYGLPDNLDFQAGRQVTGRPSPLWLPISPDKLLVVSRLAGRPRVPLPLNIVPSSDSRCCTFPPREHSPLLMDPALPERTLQSPVTGPRLGARHVCVLFFPLSVVIPCCCHSLLLCRVPLLDRGWVLAVAHVRGGGQLGPAWHEAGRGSHNKVVSVQDLEACAEALVRAGLAHPQRIALEASSAGAGTGVHTTGAGKLSRCSHYRYRQCSHYRYRQAQPVRERAPAVSCWV